MSKHDDFRKRVVHEFLPSVHFSKLEGNRGDLSRETELFGKLQELFEDVCGNDLSETDGFVSVPGVIVPEAEKTPIFVALLTLDLDSQGELWTPWFFTKWGLIDQDRLPASVQNAIWPGGKFEEYRYGYKAKIPQNVHVRDGFPETAERVMGIVREEKGGNN
jgi:hypothetical protein